MMINYMITALTQCFAILAWPLSFLPFAIFYDLFYGMSVAIKLLGQYHCNSGKDFGLYDF